MMIVIHIDSGYDWGIIDRYRSVPGVHGHAQYLMVIRINQHVSIRHGPG